jgi:hypothetical protein
MKRIFIWPSIVVGTLLFTLWGCGSSGSGGMGGTGTLKVSMTDAAPCGFDQVNVTVSSVRVHQSATANENDPGWSDITLTPPKKINLTALMNGTLDELGQTPLPAGHYTQLRLVLAPNSPTEPLNNSVVPASINTETALKTPSAAQSGLKLIHEFDVAPGTLVDLVLDFDACRSIVTTGNGGYILKPVISVIPTIVSGEITGYVDPALAGSNPMVYAELGGQVVKSTIPAQDGSFTLSPLQQSSIVGNYDVVITADDHVTAAIQSVPVSAQGVTTVSTSGEPILLDDSMTHTVSGTVTPASAEARLRATQTFASGPTIEVRSVSANLSDGTYAMTLPTGDPLLGDFGDGTLPITLTPDSTVAGLYMLEASADGYQTQSTPIDLSAGDLTDQDFALMTP